MIDHRLSLMLTAPRRLEWVQEELPSPRPDEIVVRTLSGAISIGTELPFYLGTQRGAHPIVYPRMTGYESVGEILACGEAVQGFQPGGRVLSFYGHRTHAVIPWRKAIRVPEEVPDPLALLAILGCDTLKGIHKIHPSADQRVMITGMGTIGLLALYNLTARGIIQVDVVEPLAERRDLALQLGAHHAYNLADAAKLDDDYAVAFECSSRQAAFALLQSKLASGGHLCILADGNIEPLVLTPDFHAKELSVVASSDGENYAQYADWLFHQPPSPLAKLFQLDTPFAELPQAFENLAKSEQRPVKVFVHYE